MTVDEYETIRLIDLEGFTQEECAEQMNVARSTIQSIYVEARKTGGGLVNGKVLSIEGGTYLLCDGSGTDVAEAAVIDKDRVAGMAGEEAEAEPDE